MKAGEETLVVPDGGWGWVVLLAACLSNVMVQGVMKSLGLILVEIMDVFSASTTQVAVIPSLVYFLYCSTAPLASSLCTRYSCRTVTGVGAVFAVIGIIASSFSNSIYLLYLSLGVSYGIGSGLMYTSGFLMVSMYFDKFRGLANGLCVAGNALGGVFMPFIVTFLIQLYGYHGAMLILGGLLLNCFIPPLIFHPVEKHMKSVPPPSPDMKPDQNGVVLPPAAAVVTNALEQNFYPSEDSLQPPTPCSESSEDYWADSGYNTVTQNNQDTVVQARPKKQAKPLSRESTFMNEEFYRKPSLRSNYSHVSSQSELENIPEGALLSAESALGALPSAENAFGALPSTESGLGALPSTDSALGVLPSTKSGLGALPSTESALGPLPSTESALGALPSTESALIKPVFPPLQYSRTNPWNSAIIYSSDASFKNDHCSVQSLAANHIHFDDKLADDTNENEALFDTNCKVDTLKKNFSAADGMALLDSESRHSIRRSKRRLASTRSFIDSVASSVSSVRMSNTFLGSSVNMIEDQAKAEVEAIKKKHKTNAYTEWDESDLEATIDLKIDKKLVSKVDDCETKTKEKAFDFAIIKNTKCILLLISLVTTSIGYSNFVTFLPSYTQLELNMPIVQTNLLLAIIAGTDLAGRIIGAIASKTVRWPKIYLYIFTLTSSGVGLLVLVCLEDVLAMAAFSGIFGLLSGIHIGAGPAMLGEELGAENVKYSYPISLLLQGLANLAGPMLCSALHAQTQTYVGLFKILGAVLITGGLIFVFYPLAVKFENKKKDKKSFAAKI